MFYQTWHFSRRFIGLPIGHLKSRANSFMFEKGPRTRNMSGACTPVSTRNFNALGRYLAHHTLAALTQNSCRCEYLRPGNKLSSSLRRRIHLSEKETMFVLLLCKHMIWYILLVKAGIIVASEKFGKNNKHTKVQNISSPTSFFS